MTTSGEILSVGPVGRLLDDLEAWLRINTRTLSSIGVIGMLLAAAGTVLDVLSRFLLGISILGLNEIMSLAFAIAITACLPAGLAAGINLKIDVAARLFSGRTTAWLDFIGAIALAVTFGILTQQLGIHAGSQGQQGRTTLILGWPYPPFMYALTALLAIATLVQVVVSINLGRRALLTRWVEPRQNIVVTLVVALAAIIVVAVGGAIFWNFSAVSQWMQVSPAEGVLIGFAIMWILMLGMIPMAALTAIIGLMGTAMFIGGSPALSAFAGEASGLLTNSQLATLPLFLMMGSFASASGMADDLYHLAHVLFGRFRGGLAMATIGSCAGFGALTGSSLATAAIIGRVAIPEMRQRGYSPALATGVCAAGGTLGPLIPPGSGPIIVFALLTEASIGKLFVASVVPALLTVISYFITILLYMQFSPRSVPPRNQADASSDPDELRLALRRCLPVGLLVFGVMGGLYFGFFTDTESAAVGAIGAFICLVIRGKLTRSSALEVMTETTFTTSMIYGLIIGAQAFSFFVGASSLAESTVAYISTLNWSPAVLMTAIVAGYLLLGTMMEAFAIMIITVPVITPLITSMGYDVIWWGIIMMCVVETGMIHPPFGLNVLVLKGISPDIPVGTIYKGVFPFVIADLFKLLILVLFPILTLWLPYSMR